VEGDYYYILGTKYFLLRDQMKTIPAVGTPVSNSGVYGSNLGQKIYHPDSFSCFSSASTGTL
jgi:hypothetical protein